MTWLLINNKLDKAVEESYRDLIEGSILWFIMRVWEKPQNFKRSLYPNLNPELPGRIKIGLRSIWLLHEWSREKVQKGWQTGGIENSIRKGIRWNKKELHDISPIILINIESKILFCYRVTRFRAHLNINPRDEEEITEGIYDNATNLPNTTDRQTDRKLAGRVTHHWPLSSAEFHKSSWRSGWLNTGINFNFASYSFT